MTTTSLEMIKEIEALKVRGAYLNAVRALEALQLLTEEYTGQNVEDLRQALLAAGERLSNANRSWSIVSTACNYALDPFKEQGQYNRVGDVRRIIAERSQLFTKSATDAQEAVSAVGAELIPDNATICIMSYSETMIGIFKKAWESGKRFSIIGTESRPYCEGRAMATILVNLGIDYTLITDPAQPCFVPRADLALVGVDTLVATGAIVNKVGTMNLALACQYFKKPIYAATSTHKMSMPSLEGKAVDLKVVQDNAGIAPEEILGKTNLKVENIFFEETPPEFFTGIITEYGVHPAVSARSLWDKTWQSLNQPAG